MIYTRYCKTYFLGNRTEPVRFRLKQAGREIVSPSPACMAEYPFVLDCGGYLSKIASISFTAVISVKRRLLQFNGFLNIHGLQLADKIIIGG